MLHGSNKRIYSLDPAHTSVVDIYCLQVRGGVRHAHWVRGGAVLTNTSNTRVSVTHGWNNLTLINIDRCLASVSCCMNEIFKVAYQSAIDTSSKQIFCCHRSAAGRYTCVAEGEGGLAADNATILVTEAASSPDTEVGVKDQD